MKYDRTKEQKEIERIRRQYVPRGEDKVKQLKKLDSKVKAPGRAASVFLGAAGALVMGAGMSQVMVWENMTMGLALGIPGLIAALLAYPLYTLISGRRRKKYASQILSLSNELVGE